MIITFFKPANLKNKFPVSPFNDNTFIFTTKEVKTHRDFIDILVDNCCLNIPLGCVGHSIRSDRKLSSLKKLYKDKYDYLLLDIDCDNKNNFYTLLNYFKNYKSTIFESRSFNNIDNFNVKILLDIEPCDFKKLKTIFAKIQFDLTCCVISPYSVQKIQFTAAILKNRIISENEGPVFKLSNKNSDFILKPEYNGKLSSKNSVDLCLEVFKNLGFNLHKTENNKAIFVKDNEQYYWYNDYPYQLNHINILKTINVYDIVSKYEYIDINFNEKFKTNSNETIIEINEPLLKITDEMKPMIESFLFNENSLLSIKSPMATGKSNIIEYIINESIERGFSIIIITNRITVAEDFYKRYENFKLYQNKDYNLGDNLIVQFDSLHKFNINNFDVVIMDEFTSLLVHSRTVLPWDFHISSEKQPENLVKFLSSITKRLVIADAFLTGYEHNLFNKKHKFKIQNNFREDFNLIEYKNKNTFFWCIEDEISKLKPVEKIVISCVSDNLTGGLGEMISLLHPHKKILWLSSETPESIKNIIFESFKQYNHNYWDVLIYSPTLTVGVSIKCNVKIHFHYDGCKAVDVISSLQMTRRSRNARDLRFYLGQKINRAPIDENIIREKIIKNPDSSFLLSLNDCGDVILTNFGKNVVKIDTFLNILFYEPSKTFKYLLTYQFNKLPEVNDIKTSRSFKSYVDIFKNKKELFIESLLNNNFLEQTGLNKNLININTTKNKLILFFEKIKSRTILNNDEDNKSIFLLIVKCFINDRDYLDKLRRFKILYDNKTSDDLKLYLNEAINKNNKVDIMFFNAVLKNNFLFDINYIYKPTKENTFILTRIGFKKIKNNFILEENILKLKDYIKV